jgi:YVTN family beta-propeller protein
MRSHRRWWILGLTGVVLAGLVAGAQAASDLTGLVFLANRDSHDLVVIDAATDQVISRVPVGQRPHMTVLSAAGKVYTTGTGTNDVTVVDAGTLRVEKKIQVRAKGPEHATLSPDGQFLWVANVAGNAVSVIDVAAAKTVQVVKGLSQPHNIVFAPDGKAYVTQVGSYRVAVFTPGKATPVARIAAGSPARLASLHPQKVQGVNNAALADGLLFATNQDAGEDD